MPIHIFIEQEELHGNTSTIFTLMYETILFCILSDYIEWSLYTVYMYYECRYKEDGEALLILLPSEQEAMVEELQKKKIQSVKLSV